MRTVQMTLDEELVEEVDRTVAELQTTRSAFARDALRAALDRAHELALEARQREGYARFPVKPEEFGGWEAEQVWGD